MIAFRPVLTIALAAALGCPLAATDTDRAREIVSRREYQGYRIVNPDSDREVSSIDGSNTTEGDSRLHRDTNMRESRGDVDLRSEGSGGGIDGSFFEILA